jgi:hypothetical protein
MPDSNYHRSSPLNAFLERQFKKSRGVGLCLAAEPVHRGIDPSPFDWSLFPGIAVLDKHHARDSFHFSRLRAPDEKNGRGGDYYGAKRKDRSPGHLVSQIL